MTPNLYGNLVANVVAGLTGGPGILPGVNVGDQCAVFEQVRHTALLVQHLDKGLHVRWRMWRLAWTCRIVGSGSLKRRQLGENHSGVEFLGYRLIACCSPPSAVQ